ncbi:DUF5615 family PIN-like protein [Rubrobacter aplysinae]|uniref:DUF5615 family PIN-like protein n=1 Tax=Rubrobacter aplysinae TaxID=909625 RepID=UPI00064C1939|nr:Mut7-C RNAse domain-containing protein [Rubrobacter aplysinae]
MRFLCDAMLGGLAKWLRAAGHDALYASEDTGADDREILRLAIEEGRVLLTGDGGFLEREPVRDGEVGFLLVPQAPVEEQLRIVAKRFDLTRHEPRCMRCNGELEELSREEAGRCVPPKVAERQEEFLRCRGCGRLLWYGTHWERIGARAGAGLRVAASAPDAC